MKKIKVGNKVSFKNEKGYGIVTSIKQNTYWIDLDGMEIPYDFNDLILVEAISTFSNDEEDLELDKNKLFWLIEERNKISINSTLVNTLSKDILVNLKFNDLELFFGKMAAFESLKLSHKDLQKSNFKEVIVQIIYTDKKENNLVPINKSISPKDIQLFDNKTLFTPQNKDFKQYVVELHSFFNQEKQEPKKQQEKQEIKLEPYIHINHISNYMEIDLHIHQLTDNGRSLENHEIIQIQKTKFNQAITQAIQLKIKRLIVIHGVGKGILKQILLEELQGYDVKEFYDASYSKYGMGATEIIFFG